MPIQAIEVPGIWQRTSLAYTTSSTQFTWACRLETVAKCVELGYKPWANHSDLLASCVRLLRADYCGTGTSFTKDGQLLNLYDNAGIQKDTESWVMEAGWTPQGAMCVYTAADTRFSALGLPEPSCFPSLEAKA